MRLSDEAIEQAAIANGIRKSREHWGDRYYTELGRYLFAFARAVEAATAERCAKLCEDYGDAEWAKFKKGIPSHRGNPYTEGLSDGAHEVANAIRDAYKEPTNG